MQQTFCNDCLAVGIDKTFFSDKKHAEHATQHRVGLISHTCACGAEFANNGQGRDSHNAMCRLQKKKQQSSKRRDDDDEEDEDAIGSSKDRRVMVSTCPICGEDFSERTFSAFVLHQENCVNSRPRDPEENFNFEAEAAPAPSQDQEIAGSVGDVLAEDALENGLRVGQAAFPFESSDADPEKLFNDFGPAPPWTNDKNFCSTGDTEQSYNGLLCDAILLNTLRAEGHAAISNAALETVYRVLNNLEFREAFARGEFSSSYREARKKEKSTALSKFKRVVHNGSVCHVRDLKEVCVELMGDQAVLKGMDFDGTDDVVTENDGISWGTN